jgi:hypothetical protein
MRAKRVDGVTGATVVSTGDVPRERMPFRGSPHVSPEARGWMDRSTCALCGDLQGAVNGNQTVLSRFARKAGQWAPPHPYEGVDPRQGLLVLSPSYGHGFHFDFFLKRGASACCTAIGVRTLHCVSNGAH